MVNKSLCALLGLGLLCVFVNCSEQVKEEYAENVKDKEPPQNVEVVAVSSSELKVTWDLPNTFPDHFRIAWHGSGITPGDDVTTGVTYHIKELMPCTEYFVIVTSVYGTEIFSSNAAGKTLSDVPPEPRECRSDKISSTTVTSRWVIPETNCQVFVYNVSWSWSPVWNDSLGDQASDTTGKLTYTAEGIRPASRVDISISALSSIDYGPPCEFVIQTEEDVPSSPTIIDYTLESNGVTLIWEAPEEANGIITSYRIFRTSDSGEVEKYTTSDNATSIVLSDFPPCHSYNVSVAASTSKGFGDESELWEIDLGGGGPLEEVHCIAETSRNFSVEWSYDSVSCSSEPNRVSWNYTVLWSGDAGDDIIDIPGSSTNFEFVDAIPYTDYDVCVTVNEAEACCSLVTPEEAPSSPTIETISSVRGNVLLSWSPPAEANGIVRSYSVSWENEDGGTGSKDFGAVTEGQIESLEACNYYDFKVAAFTNDWGQESRRKEIEVANYVEFLNCTARGTDTVVLWYEFANLECRVHERNLNWTIVVLWNNNKTSTDSTTISNAPTSDSDTIRDLLPYSSVEVCTSLPNRDEEKLCCNALTEEDVPSKPTALTVSDVTTTSAVISWALPHEVNGDIKAWEVSVQRNNEEVISETLPRKEMMFEISNLEPSTKYFYFVKCQNGAGVSGEAESSFTTPDEEDSLVLIVALSVGGGLVLIALSAGVVVYIRRQKKEKKIDSVMRNPPVTRQYSDPWGTKTEKVNEAYEDERF